MHVSRRGPIQTNASASARSCSRERRRGFLPPLIKIGHSEKFLQNALSPRRRNQTDQVAMTSEYASPSSYQSPTGQDIEAADNIDDAALARVMRVVPLGAGVLAGSAVALLVLGYLAIYLLVFVPRGVV